MQTLYLKLTLIFTISLMSRDLINLIYSLKIYSSANGSLRNTLVFIKTATKRLGPVRVFEKG